MNSKISFVVIARNEVYAIKHCLDGLKKIQSGNVDVVLVDSSSNDGTEESMLEFAQQFPAMTTLVSCKGDLNASVVRNVGFSKSIGEYVFFVDGDTEINADFFEAAISKLEKDQAIVAVTGKLKDVMYSDDFKEILAERNDRNNINSEHDVIKFGGNVCIRRSALDAAGGWDENFVANEDFDLAIRLSEIGRIKAVPIYIGKHHTRKSEIYQRSYADLIKGTHRFYGQLLRKHTSSLGGLKKCLSFNRGHQIGMMYYFFIFLFVSLLPVLGWIPFKVILLVFLFDLVFGLFKGRDLLDRFVLRLCIPFVVFLGFFMPFKLDGNVSFSVVFDIASTSGDL